jgi:hypothetical protein
MRETSGCWYRRSIPYCRWRHSAKFSSDRRDLKGSPGHCCCLKPTIMAIAILLSPLPMSATASAQSSCLSGGAAAGPPNAPSDTSTEPIQKEPSITVHFGSRTSATFYGFVRMDLIADSSRPDSLQSPLFIQPTDTVTTGRRAFTLHSRLTRVGVNYQGPRVGDAPVSGTLEFDFQNGGRESRAVPRIRHGFFQLSWRRVSLLVGQTWDVISPLYPAVNADTMMWNAGNLGDRRPQIRVSYGALSETTVGLMFVAAIGLTGAVTGQDLDRDGLLDGEESGVPNFQLRVARKARSTVVGLSAHIGREQFEDAAGTSTSRLPSYSVNVDYSFSPRPVLTVKGELWVGKNLSDFRGAVGQGVEPISRRTIRSSGGWAELLLAPRESIRFGGGYSRDDPKDADLGPFGRSSNRAWYTVSQLIVGQGVTLGIDYVDWLTTYADTSRGHDHRVNAYFMYTF